MAAERSGSIRADGWAEPITGFRVVGAAAVVAAHVFLSTRIYPWKSFLHLAGLVVPLFLLFSVYALYRPFVADHLAERPTEAAGRFWWRRFVRIYPLYAFALTVYFLVLPTVRPDGGRVADYVKMYLFGQVYDPNLTTFTGIPVAWFLCVIVVFYLLMPASARLGLWLSEQTRPCRGGRRAALERGHATVAVWLIVVGQSTRFVWLRAGDPDATAVPIANLDFYGLGILLALASLRLRDRIPLPSAIDSIRRIPMIAIAVFATGAVLLEVIAHEAGVITDPHESIRRYAIYSFMTIPLTITMVLGNPHRSFNRLLSWSGWRWLSTLSLPVFLWHQLVLGGFDLHISEIGTFRIGSDFVTGVIMVTGTAAVSVLSSVIWKRPLDSPARRWARPPWPPGAAVRVARHPVGFLAVAGLLAASLPFAIGQGASPFSVAAGTGMVTVTGARAGDRVSIDRIGLDETADPGSTGDEEAPLEVDVDEAGTVVVRGLSPGGHRVSLRRGDRDIHELDVNVRGIADAPKRSWFENAELRPGRNWLETRDGTLLDAFVSLPGPVEDGPYPTVIELSAYRIADDDSAQPATASARRLGYATVSVGVRGSGCSAGAFEFFGPATMADGHDVVEVVARQSWVAGGKAGLIGFSMGGMYALQAAAAAPPSLASVTALAVPGDVSELFRPGGLLDAGFARDWLVGLTESVAPSGASWVKERIDAGDRTCEKNQLLHGHAVDLPAVYLEEPVENHLMSIASPATWGADIVAPTFLAGQMQDADVGTSLTRALNAFEGIDELRIVLGNGMHGDALAPQVMSRVHEFLGFTLTDGAAVPVDVERFLEGTGDAADAHRYPIASLGGSPDDGRDPQEARRRYFQRPRVEVLIDSGMSAAPGVAAAPAAIEMDRWPPDHGVLELLHLGADGRLGSEGDTAIGDPERITLVPDRAAESFSTEGSTLFRNELSTWRHPTDGSSVHWTGDEAERDHLMIGNPWVELWVDTGGQEGAIQAVLTEIDPMGNETYLQAGWRRILPTTVTSDDGRWRRVQIELGPVAHVRRAGSRLRLHLGSPGDGQTPWAFELPADTAPSLRIAQDGDHRAVLAVVHTEPPADIEIRGGCGDLRGQPCRPMVDDRVMAPSG